MELPEGTQGVPIENRILTKVSEQRLVSNTGRQIVEILNYVILCTLISAFGIVTNIMNLVVFLKQGLNTTINISFFALAISDLSSLIFQQWFSICVNPLFQRADILIVPSEIAYVTGGVTRVCCARITFLVTVYVTAERCLCVAFPLHVKQMITPRRTAIIICIIYISSIFFTVPVHYANNIRWKFYPERNKTLLGHVPSSNRDKVEQLLFISQSIIGLISFVAIIVFTGILINILQQKSNWRNTATANTKQAGSMSSKDRQTMNLVVLIAVVLIISNTPGAFLFMATFFEPEMSSAGRYTNLFFVSWSFAFLFETVNSSVNIFLYLKLSSKYRETFFKLISSCAAITVKK